MTISSGTRLGPYEIVAPLGAGGMGEVWKARDTRLDRSVAIKVLPAEFSDNAQLKLRFEREAKTISQLNHPHICTLYDVGDGYLVMELLEGESLAEKLAKGALPFDQVLRYGIEIAEALEKAHKAGIVHRDLKPGNVMITKSGAKLLDFGLAKPAAVFDAAAATQHKPLTQEGSIVGTFQYMAPEQIEGGDVDGRSDIFAFGAVLYEMATGRRAFEGKSKASLIASILTAEPQPISAIQPMAPATFDRIVRGCLAKDPDERWQSARDVATQLRWLQTPDTSVSRSRPAHIFPWLIAIAAIVVAVVIARPWRPRDVAAPPVAVQSLILPPPGTQFRFNGPAAPPVISPDGRKIVFGAGETGNPRQLYVRSLDSLIAQPLAGTSDAMFPFWSPDSKSVGFLTVNAVKRLDLFGGAPTAICAVNDGRGASWSPDGQTIVFAGRFSGISRVSAQGGKPELVTKLEPGVSSHRYPEFLPDGRHFLYLTSPTGARDENNAVWVGSLDGSAPKKLIGNAEEPHYFDRSIVFVRNSVLFVQAFDPDRLTIAGEPVQLKEQEVHDTASFSRSVVTIAPDGTLVYQKGVPVASSQLVWMDRTGRVIGTIGEPAPYRGVEIAPDQHAVLISHSLEAGMHTNIWSFDLQRGSMTRVTFGDGFDYGPIWSPDARRIMYSSATARSVEFRIKDLVSGMERTVLSFGLYGTPSPTSWSPDGGAILHTSNTPPYTDSGWLSLSDGKDHSHIGLGALSSGARFSPDGKWIAYQATESGQQAEIYISPFPPTGAKWQVSTASGVAAHWRADGKELFYVVPGAQKMMAVPVHLASTPEIGRATELFTFRIGYPSTSLYDVSRDGQRFLINTRIGEEPPPEPLVLVQNFGNEVRAALKR